MCAESICSGTPGAEERAHDARGRGRGTIRGGARDFDVRPGSAGYERARVAWSRCNGSEHAVEQHDVGMQERHGGRGRRSIAPGTWWRGLPPAAHAANSGRVGDSPLIGCGCYADLEAGGISCTGHGEGIMKIVMAKLAADLLGAAENAREFYGKRRANVKSARVSAAAKAALAVGEGSQHTAQFVADACVRKLAHRAHTTGGLILLDRDGNQGRRSTRCGGYGFVDAQGKFKASLPRCTGNRHKTPRGTLIRKKRFGWNGDGGVVNHRRLTVHVTASAVAVTQAHRPRFGGVPVEALGRVRVLLSVGRTAMPANSNSWPERWRSARRLSLRLRLGLLLRLRLGRGWFCAWAGGSGIWAFADLVLAAFAGRACGASNAEAGAGVMDERAARRLAVHATTASNSR